MVNLSRRLEQARSVPSRTVEYTTPGRSRGVSEIERHNRSLALIQYVVLRGMALGLESDINVPVDGTIRTNSPEVRPAIEATLRSSLEVRRIHAEANSNRKKLERGRFKFKTFTPNQHQHRLDLGVVNKALVLPHARGRMVGTQGATAREVDVPAMTNMSVSRDEMVIGDVYRAISEVPHEGGTFVATAEVRKLADGSIEVRNDRSTTRSAWVAMTFKQESDLWVSFGPARSGMYYKLEEGHRVRFMDEAEGQTTLGAKPIYETRNGSMISYFCDWSGFVFRKRSLYALPPEWFDHAKQVFTHNSFDPLRDVYQPSDSVYLSAYVHEIVRGCLLKDHGVGTTQEDVIDFFLETLLMLPKMEFGGYQGAYETSPFEVVNGSVICRQEHIRAHLAYIYLSCVVIRVDLTEFRTLKSIPLRPMLSATVPKCVSMSVGLTEYKLMWATSYISVHLLGALVYNRNVMADFFVSQKVDALRSEIQKMASIPVGTANAVYWASITGVDGEIPIEGEGAVRLPRLLMTWVGDSPMAFIELRSTERVELRLDHTALFNTTDYTDARSRVTHAIPSFISNGYMRILNKLCSRLNTPREVYTFSWSNTGTLIPNL